MTSHPKGQSNPTKSNVKQHLSTVCCNEPAAELHHKVSQEIHISTSIQSVIRISLKQLELSTKSFHVLQNVTPNTVVS